MSSTTIVWSLAACAAAGAAVFLGLHHPIAPLVCLAGVVAALAACLWWQSLWLFLIPASLPWLNFAPWTGWILIEEFDLLLLTVLAAGYARLAAHSVGRDKAARNGAGLKVPVPIDRVTLCLVVAVLLSVGAGMAKGLLDAGSLQFDWYQGYVDPLNSLRAAKALLFSVLTLPLLNHAARGCPPGLDPRLVPGVVTGVGFVCAVVLWERLAFPGILDFSAVYRVTAWFWEMHVGGAAIDAYLAMVSPFVLLFWLRSRTAASRVISSFLLLLLAYAVLVTFSRGLYAALFVSLSVFAAVAAPSRDEGSTANYVGTVRRRQIGASTWRLLGLPIAALAVLGWVTFGADSFLLNRLLNTDKVLAGRMVHWSNSLALMRSPADWLLGIGLGRFPARYAGEVEDGDFSGAVRMGDSAPDGAATSQFVILQGPVATDQKGGLFALTQRVSPQAGARYLASGQYRAATPAALVLKVCERHLLYNWSCHKASFDTQPGVSGWQSFSLDLKGELFAATSWFAPRLAFYTISVVNAGGQVDLARLQLATADNAGLLLNGDFAAGLARWFPAAQYYFVPWHTDSLLLELVVERGLAGLLAIACLLIVATVAAIRLRRLDHSGAACLCASLAGVLVVGVVSSVLDVPRVAFLWYFLMLYLVIAGRPAIAATPDSGGGRPEVPS